ncbi:unnamed protein product, partial [Brassica oleracea var. botrytis]
VLQNRAQLVFVHALSWGRPTAEPLKKVLENGFFEMNKLIIKVEVKIVQAFDERKWEGDGRFQWFPSSLHSGKREYPFEHRLD